MKVEAAVGGELEGDRREPKKDEGPDRRAAQQSFEAVDQRPIYSKVARGVKAI